MIICGVVSSSVVKKLYFVSLDVEGVCAKTMLLSFMMILQKHERGIIMEQRLVATRHILSEKGNFLTLQYFILKEELLSCKHKFGIMIQECNSGEKAFAPQLCTSSVQAFRLIHQLSDYSVTPTTLLYVLTDWGWDL